MRKETKRICALVVIGLLVVLMLTQSGVAPPGPDWNTDGNSADSTDFLGTTNDEDLRLYTNNNQRAVIKSDGKVGIGTASPSSELDVAGTVEMTGFKLTTSPTTGYVLTSDAEGVGTWASTVGGTGSPNSIAIWTDSTTMGSSVISQNNGKIGIGTGNAVGQFEIQANGEEIPQLRLSRTNGAYTNINTTMSGHLYIETSSGKVGIGTTDPTHTLHVIGDVNITGSLNITGDISTGGIYYDDENNRIGINTTDPQYQFEVVGEVWLNSDTIIIGDGTFYNKVQKNAKLSTKDFRIVIDCNDDETDRYFSIEKDEDKNAAQGTGTELMRCQENGNVGIATAAPTEKLDVNGKVRIRDLTVNDNLFNIIVADATGVLYQNNGSWMLDADWYEVGTTDPPNDITDEIFTQGKVGIGDSTPEATLDIEKEGTAKSILDIFHITNSVSDVDMCETETSILFNQYYYDAASPAIAEAGRILVGTETNWTASASTKDGYMAFHTVKDGTVSEAIRIDSAGNVGIGTANPGAKLEVAGQVKITGGSPGVDKVLTSDANGLL